MKSFLIAALIGAGLLLASNVFAGAITEEASCYKNGDGSGFCYGSLRGFRNHTNPAVGVAFTAGPSYSSTFSGTWTTGSMYCVVPAGSALLDWWKTMLTYSGWFSISWNTSGQCVSLVLVNGSAYRAF